MKKILMVLMAGIYIAACNNSGENESQTDKDTVSLEQNRDVNNRNTTVYDSATGNQNGDTSSYERMPNRVNDSIPQ